MPVTAVFSHATGQLQQVQVGAADIVATIAAAHSGWGWIGGLSGISSLLRITERKNESVRIDQLFECIHLDSPTCHILGQTGLQMVSLADNEAFGESAASKLIGTTLCALAHNVSATAAVTLFTRYFVDGLFGKGLKNYPGSKETFSSFLHDNHRAILNEGAIHQLAARFDSAIDGLGTSSGLKVAHDTRVKGDTMIPEADSYFIEGFLRWLFKVDAGLPYYTRSAAVGRIAVCLRSVGYKIGNVIRWDGKTQRPNPPRGLVLVTGGSSDTDEFASYGASDNITAPLVSHYHWKTVGAMFWNAFDQEFTNTHQESFQQDFDEIDASISYSLEGFQWCYVDTRRPDVQAYPIWNRPTRPTSSRIAISLATVFFPGSVDTIAPYYEKIANEKYLGEVKTRSWGRNDYGLVTQPFHDLSNELQRFLVITASICISVLGRIAGDNFKDVRHSTLGNIFGTRHFRQLCSYTDTILSGGSSMGMAIRAVAAIHCAVNLSSSLVGNREADQLYGEGTDFSHNGALVGWRSERYAVLPNLLFQLSTPLSHSVLGLHCTDCFIANLPTQRDGSIHSEMGGVAALMFTSEALKPWQDDHPNQDLERGEARRESSDSITLGPPLTKAPDKPLYLSIERPFFATNEPEISLCGRIDGESIGTVLIHDALKTLALSWSDDEGYYYNICTPGKQHGPLLEQNQAQITADTVYNMPASRYCERIDYVPRADGEKKNGENCVYVQVAGDTPWAIFLAGQSPLSNRVAFGCAGCALRTGGNCISRIDPLKTIIGYQ